MRGKTLHQPLFPTEFIHDYIQTFDLRSIANLEDVFESVKGLVDELESGKLHSLKEEEIKSRFVNTIFGDILGYNYKNPNTWLLREEKKSTVDGTKPDAVLGFLHKDKEKDDVRVVIEIKSSKIGLDKSTRKKTSKTPVEQAFEYVPKSGGNCKWVVVSNLTEIRFYSSIDCSRYQSYFLRDLLEVSKLKEMIFLFHKDRLLKENILEKSETEKLFLKAQSLKKVNQKSVHIIDKIFDSLKDFEGLKFIDPEYLVSIPPFNILDDYVWHYDSNTLFTLNPEIYDLLKEIKIVNHSIRFSDKLKKEISDIQVDDALGKLEWVFRFLNDCMIFHIKAIKDYQAFEIRSRHNPFLSIRHIFGFSEDIEGISKRIVLQKGGKCECVSCTYRNLNFKDLIKRLNSSKSDSQTDNLEIAYGHFLMGTDDYQNSYLSFKNIARHNKGKERKSVDYFLSNLNIKFLHNLIESSTSGEVKQKILGHIKSIDLDRVIYDDIEYNIKTPVKKYILKVKEDQLFISINNKVEELLEKIEELGKQYESGGMQNLGPNLPNDLAQLYYKLYLHVNKNFIIKEGFYQHKNLVRKVFKGLLLSYKIPEWGIDSFSEFFVMEAILHINKGDLQTLLDSSPELKLEKGGTELLLEKLSNFTTSFFTNGLFSKEPIENTDVIVCLKNHLMSHKLGSIFSNMFSILSRIEITKEQFKQNAVSIIKFLKVEEKLAWDELKELGVFLQKKGFLFSARELVDILKVSVDKEKPGEIKYKELISSIPQAIKHYYPEFKLQDVKMVQTIILKHSSDTGNYIRCRNVIDLCLICDEKCNNLLLSAFEQNLNNYFDRSLYIQLIRNTSFEITRGDYFKQYSECINIERDHAHKHGMLKLTDIVFMAYIYDLYQNNIEFTDERVKAIRPQNKFEKWILNPNKFDYSNFNPIWLTDVNYSVILKRLKGINEIEDAIEKQLKNAYNAILAEIKYKYFI